jgi:quercetin dioxygenase-like cupin family protein
MFSIIKKKWGEEHVLASNEKYGYSGKRMKLAKTGCCSIHFHALKCETFFVSSGMMILQRWYQDGHIETTIMRTGNVLTIYPNTPHRFYGIKETVFYEFSSFDSPNDSYRISSSSIDMPINQDLLQGLSKENVDIVLDAFYNQGEQDAS